jgi:AraC-like DNA-binding protein
MSRDEAVQLARDIALRGETIRVYAQRQGVSASTVTSRAYRAGVRLGVEIRRWRVELVLRLKAQDPAIPISRLALEAGYCVPSHFTRARRRLARWDAAA